MKTEYTHLTMNHDGYTVILPFTIEEVYDCAILLVISGARRRYDGTYPDSDKNVITLPFEWKHPFYLEEAVAFQQTRVPGITFGQIGLWENCTESMEEFKKLCEVEGKVCAPIDAWTEYVDIERVQEFFDIFMATRIEIT